MNSTRFDYERTVSHLTYSRDVPEGVSPARWIGMCSAVLQNVDPSMRFHAWIRSSIKIARKMIP